MLSRFLLRTARTLPMLLPTSVRATITTAKGLNQRKKKLYESQVSETVKSDYSLQRQEERRQKEAVFQKFLFQIAREMAQAFASRSVPQKKTGEVQTVLAKSIARLQREHRQLDARDLIHFAEVVKCMSLMRLEQLEHIEVVYTALERFMRLPEQQRALGELSGTGWEAASLQLRVRAVSVLQFLGEESREWFLGQYLWGYAGYFKSAEMLVLLYEKWRYGYPLSYEVLDQIHKNQYFCGVEDVGQAYLKMLFVDSIRGEFGPNDDGIYSRVLNSINDRPNILVHSAFSKLIKMLHSQNYFVQTETSRANLEYSLNIFINIAKNQNYEHSTLSLNQLVEIYLGFEESSSTGEILLSEITYYARVAELQLTQQNFALYQQLLLSVVRNLEPKLKYEHRDSLNKEYTNDTVNFLREMVPKYIPLWPEVILHLNHAAHELFLPDDPLLTSFQATYALLLATHARDISLRSLPFLTALLRFLVAHRFRPGFVLPDQHFLALLGEFGELREETVSSGELETLYLVLSLLGERMQEARFAGAVRRVNERVEGRIQVEMGRERSSSPINSLDDEIVWLALCSAQVRAQGFAIDESLLEVFMNEKMLCMLNSLKYTEVVEMLEFSVGLSRLNPEVYERLLCGLSTFLLYICERNNRSTGHYYLNHKYQALYPRVCRLVLDNHSVFRAVPNKNAFRVLQVMFIRSLGDFSAEDTLRLLETLGDPAFLTVSMARVLEEQKFSVAQLEPYENSLALKNFEYYNKSLLRFFEGKYNEAEVRSKLRGDTLTRQEIIEFFSRSEVYQTIIMDGDLSIRFEMPEPDTNIANFKLMYALQRIFQRTKQFNPLDFKDDYPYFPPSGSRPPAAPDVDFSPERNYIDREVLAPTFPNPFRLQSRSLPRYIKLEVWMSYVFFSRECKVSPRDLENNQMFTDEILNKVIKGCLYGSYEKIREVLKEFSCSEQLTAALREAKIQFEQHGAAIEIRGEDKESTLFTLLCTNNSNYKVLYICAHLMTKHGNQVAVLRDNYSLDAVLAFLKRHFLKAPPAPTDAKDQNDIEDE